MSGRSFPVLMYHRVVERGPETACYFARGTAIEPAVLRQQVSGLVERYWFATLPRAWRWLHDPDDDGDGTGRPPCVLSLDDGYRDAAHALRAALGDAAPLTLFVSAQTTGPTPQPLWFDSYYAILHRAGNARVKKPGRLGLDPTAGVPRFVDDPGWWITGPPKQLLHTMTCDEAVEWLSELADALAVTPDMAALRGLYLDDSDLTKLIAAGHTAGGHGVTHRRLTELSQAERAAEIRGSEAMLERLQQPQPWVFAYPDGRCQPGAAAQLEASRFALACSTTASRVEPGVATAMNVPRLAVDAGA